MKKILVLLAGILLFGCLAFAQETTTPAPNAAAPAPAAASQAPVPAAKAGKRHHRVAHARHHRRHHSTTRPPS